MTTKRKSRAEAREETRRALVQSASEIFARRGYHAATVDEIAENAGYSQGALYSNFASKDALLQATAQAYVEQQAERWAQDFQAAKDAEAQLRAPADAWMAAVSERPEEFLLFMELWALAARNPSLKKGFAAAWSSGRSFMAEAVSQIAAEANLGLTEQGTADAVALVDALGIGLAVRKMVQPEVVPDKLFGRAIVEWLPALLERWAPPEGNSR